MANRTGTVARRWVALVLPLALFLALVVAWSAWAQAPLRDNDGGLALYEVRSADSEAEQWEIVLPSGLEYVGLARGSLVVVEPEISERGRRLLWRGSFPGSTVLRFWIAPAWPVLAPATLPVIGLGGEAVLVEPEIALPTEPRAEVPAGLPVGAIGVTKTVEPQVLEPGDSRWLPVYEVIFTNASAQVVFVEWVTDTLPGGFVFGGMALGSEVGEPVDDVEPDIVWQGLAVPANGTLTMRYRVRATDMPGEYRNSVVGQAGSEQIGPVSAALLVRAYQAFVPVVLKAYRPPAPVWQLVKTADPTQVAPGDPVTYTVLISNVGDRAGTLGAIADALPEWFEFVAMVPGSEVIPPPVGTTGVITWFGSWELPPGEDLKLIYQVNSGGSGDQVNTARAYAGDNTLVATGSSTVTVGGGLPFQEDFSSGVSQDWQPFLNWPGLDPDYWSWAGDVGNWGIVNYDFHPDDLPEYDGYNLFIYDAPGAQGWADYRIEARIKDSKGVDATSGLTGIWFRGTYQDSGLLDGKTVGGYYVYMRQADEHLYLMRTPPSNPTFGSQVQVANYSFAPGILTHKWYKFIIEVQGAHIQVWFEYDEDGISNPVKAFDYTEPAGAWSKGTVGLAVYNTIARFDYIYVLPLD